MTRQSQDSVSRWLEAAGRVPLLTPAEELHLGSLIRAWQDHPAGPADAPAAIRRRGLKARDRMVSGNLRLCIAVASKGHHGLTMEDSLQVAAIGLQRAAERFDPARGYKFSTFAYWWIRQAISREAIASSRLIRIPSSYGTLPGQIHRAARDLSAELGRQPTPAELAERLGIRESELRLFIERTATPASLDQRVGAGERSALVDVLPAEGEPEVSDVPEAVAEAMQLLSPTQREVVARYHLGEDRLIDVAKDMGISRDAARKYGDQGLRNLRKLLRDL